MSVLSRAGWSASASSENGSYPVSNVLDANLSTFWVSGGDAPQHVILNLGSAQEFNGIQVYPRAGFSQPNAVELYVSDNGTDWGSAVASASFANTSGAKWMAFTNVTKQYVKLLINSRHGTDANVQVAEIYLHLLGGAEDRTAWEAFASDSYSGYGPEKAIDGTTTTAWVSGNGVNYPHSLWVDMKRASSIAGIKYNPRTDLADDRFGVVEGYLSDDGSTWGTAVATATWEFSQDEKTLSFTAQAKRWFKLLSTAKAVGGRDNFGSCSELYAVAGGTPITGVCTLTGQGALTSIGRLTSRVTTALSGLGGLSAEGITVIFLGPASLTGAGDLTANGVMFIQGQTTLSGFGALSAGGLLQIIANAQLAGAGAFTSEGHQEIIATSQLTGTGALTAQLRQLHYVDALLAATGSLIANGHQIIFANTTLSGQGIFVVNNTPPTVIGVWGGNVILLDAAYGSLLDTYQLLGNLTLSDTLIGTLTDNVQ